MSRTLYFRLVFAMDKRAFALLLIATLLGQTMAQQMSALHRVGTLRSSVPPKLRITTSKAIVAWKQDSIPTVSIFNISDAAMEEKNFHAKERSFNSSFYHASILNVEISGFDPDKVHVVLAEQAKAVGFKDEGGKNRVKRNTASEAGIIAKETKMVESKNSSKAEEVGRSPSSKPEQVLGSTSPRNITASQPKSVHDPTASKTAPVDHPVNVSSPIKTSIEPTANVPLNGSKIEASSAVANHPKSGASTNDHTNTSANTKEGSPSAVLDINKNETSSKASDQSKDVKEPLRKEVALNSSSSSEHPKSNASLSANQTDANSVQSKPVDAKELSKKEASANATEELRQSNSLQNNSDSNSRKKPDPSKPINVKEAGKKVYAPLTFVDNSTSLNGPVRLEDKKVANGTNSGTRNLTSSASVSSRGVNSTEKASNKTAELLLDISKESHLSINHSNTVNSSRTNQTHLSANETHIKPTNQSKHRTAEHFRLIDDPDDAPNDRWMEHNLVMMTVGLENLEMKEEAAARWELLELSKSTVVVSVSNAKSGQPQVHLALQTKADGEGLGAPSTWSSSVGKASLERAEIADAKHKEFLEDYQVRFVGSAGDDSIYCALEGTKSSKLVITNSFNPAKPNISSVLDFNKKMASLKCDNIQIYQIVEGSTDSALYILFSCEKGNAKHIYTTKLAAPPALSQTRESFVTDLKTSTKSDKWTLYPAKQSVLIHQSFSEVAEVHAFIFTTSGWQKTADICNNNCSLLSATVNKDGDLLVVYKANDGEVYYEARTAEGSIHKGSASAAASQSMEIGGARGWLSDGCERIAIAVWEEKSKDDFHVEMLVSYRTYAIPAIKQSQARNATTNNSTATVVTLDNHTMIQLKNGAGLVTPYISITVSLFAIIAYLF